MRVLILTSPREEGWIDNAPTEVSRGLRDFIANLNTDPAMKFEVTTLDKIDFVITKGNVKITDRYNERDLAGYDLIHFRNATLFQDHARAVAIYMKHHGKKVLESIDTNGPEYGKLSQMVLFALNGARVPDTWCAWNLKDTVKLLQVDSVPYPFILKSNNGIKGHDNYLVDNREQLLTVSSESDTIQFIVQRYIPNDSDYRVLFCGSSDPLIFRRIAAKGSHLNNTSRGGMSSEVDLEKFDAKALKLSKEAARLTHRLLAGVDVIQNNETGEWYILEVNANPALSSGTLLDRKVIKYKQMLKDIL